MSATITATTTTTHTANGFSQEVNKARDSLHEILEKYIQWEDSLSDNLYEWGCEALKSTGNEDQQEKSVLTDSVERINTLMRSILRNPLTGLTWESPYLDQRGNIVEERVLESLKRTNPQALKSASPHEFAKAMIAWGSHMQTLFQRAQGQTEVVVAEGERRIAAQVYTYLTQLRASKLEEGQLELQKSLLNVNQALDSLKQKVEERVKEETQRHIEKARAHEVMVQEKLKSLDQNYRSQIDASSSLISSLDRDLKEGKKAIDTLSAKERQIASDLQAERQRTAALQRRVNDLQEEVDDLEDSGICSIM